MNIDDYWQYGNINDGLSCAIILNRLMLIGQYHTASLLLQMVSYVFIPLLPFLSYHEKENSPFLQFINKHIKCISFSVIF